MCVWIQFSFCCSGTNGLDVFTSSTCSIWFNGPWNKQRTFCYSKNDLSRVELRRWRRHLIWMSSDEVKGRQQILKKKKKKKIVCFFFEKIFVVFILAAKQPKQSFLGTHKKKRNHNKSWGGTGGTLKKYLTNVLALFVFVYHLSFYTDDVATYYYVMSPGH